MACTNGKNCLDEQSKSRPADIFVIQNRNNEHQISYDVAVPSSYNILYNMEKESIKPGIRHQNIEKNKIKKYHKLILNGKINYKPIIIESFGQMNDNLKDLIKLLAKDIATNYRTDYNIVLNNIG